jgi:HSP20 family protein
MMLVRRDPSTPIRNLGLANLGDFSSVFSDFDRLWNEVGNTFFNRADAFVNYPVDLYETDQNLVLEMAVPGISASDLDISIENRQLTILGRYPLVEEEGRRYWVQTIPHGEFRRTLTLPVAVVTDDIQARVDSGVLTLTMPKVAEARAKKIAVQTAQA